MPTIFNPKRRNAIFINTGGTVSPTPAPPSFSNTKSLSYDGVDEYVDCGNISALNGVTEATWMGWFKRAGSGSFYIMSTYGTGQIQFFVLQANSNVTVYAATSTGAQRTMARANITWSVGQWYHLAFVYNEAEPSNADKMKIYIDGVLQTNAVAGASLTSLNSSTAPFNIGRLGGATTNEFNGNIDEVAIFTSALTSEQINTIATAPSDLSTYNPIAWYRCGDNSTYQTPQILMPENTNKDKVSNWSLSFDGVDDYIDMGNPTELQITGELSISAWVKTTANDGVIAGKSNTSGTQRSYGLWSDRFGSPQTPVFFVWGSGTYYETPNTGPRVDDGNWHHLLATFKPSTYLRLYIDGQLEQENTTSIPASIDNDVVDFNIGRAANGTFLYNGQIDEVAVWNTDQSANVSTIYNGGEPTTISGAVAYWKLGEQATFSTNWTIPDQVGSNDGTSANMTIEDRIGNASNSSLNSVSFNMESTDIDNNVPT